MTKTKSIQLIVDGPLINSRQSFGEDHLDFVSDKKEETRGISGFGVFKGGGGWSYENR